MTKQARPRIIARIAIVRLVLFFLFTTLLYVGWQAAMFNILPHVPAQMKDAVRLGGVAIFCLVAIPLYALLVRWLERRKANEFALVRGIPLLIGGVVLAFLMFCCIYAIFFGLGIATWHGVNGYASVAAFAAMAIGSGVGEELMFRGGLFRILEDSLGTGLALILSGAVFGGLHLLNAHATLFGAAAIALEAGVLLGAAYSATRSLWLPIGIHIGWNFTEGGVFGAAISGGIPGGKGILDAPLSGPELFSGGTFGPEASVIALAVCTALGLYFVVRTYTRGRWVPLSFHMMLD